MGVARTLFSSVERQIITAGRYSDHSNRCCYRVMNNRMLPGTAAWRFCIFIRSQGRGLDGRVTVIMITHNRGEQILIALEHLLKLPERPRVIVVDNGSSDETAGITRDMSSQVDMIALGHNLGCAGRNVGVFRADTPYVAFSDDDSWWQPGALARAAELFDANPELGLIAARILVGSDQRLDPLCHAMATSPLARDHWRNGQSTGVPIVGFAACGTVVRRTAFLEAGGFDGRFGVGGEEQVLALDLLRNGWRLAYIEEVVAHHHPSPVRDAAKRQRLEVRNVLWSAWLRRPVASAFRVTWRVIRLALGNDARRAGLAEAMRGLPWVFSARNPVPAEIARQLEIAEEAWLAASALE